MLRIMYSSDNFWLTLEVDEPEALNPYRYPTLTTTNAPAHQQAFINSYREGDWSRECASLGDFPALNTGTRLHDRYGFEKVWPSLFSSITTDVLSSTLPYFDDYGGKRNESDQCQSAGQHKNRRISRYGIVFLVLNWGHGARTADTVPISAHATAVIIPYGLQVQHYR